jgi:hypothetical protein
MMGLLKCSTDFGKFRGHWTPYTSLATVPLHAIYRAALPTRRKFTDILRVAVRTAHNRTPGRCVTAAAFPSFCLCFVFRPIFYHLTK